MPPIQRLKDLEHLTEILVLLRRRNVPEQRLEEAVNQRLEGLKGDEMSLKYFGWLAFAKDA